MSDEIKNAVIAALQDPQAGNAIAASVQKAVQEKMATTLPDVVAGSVKGALLGKDKAEEDPYRTTLHFLAGLIAFCLAVIVGVFNAFPAPPLDAASPIIRMLGGVLAWMAITALAATVSTGITQILKRAYRKQPSEAGPPWWGLALLIGLPVLPGAMAVAYCIRAGAALLDSDAELVGMAKAICTLARF
jgi:membrane-associated protease RseP (regulator of RpoE activity)